MVKPKKCTRISQSGNSYAINCTIQGVRLILSKRFDWPYMSFFIDQSEC